MRHIDRFLLGRWTAESYAVRSFFCLFRLVYTFANRSTFTNRNGTISLNRQYSKHEYIKLALFLANLSKL